MVRSGTERRRVAPIFAGCGALLLLLLAGCGSFPIRLYVERAVLRELETTRRAAPPAGIERQLRERLGYEGGPVELIGEDFHRLDRGPRDAFDAAEATSTASRWTADLRPGDLVLAKNIRAQSLGSCLALAEFTYHDHVGVLVHDEGRWQVCESWATFHGVGPSADFASRFRGKVDIVSLERFMRRYEVLEVIRWPDAERNERVARAAVRSVSRDISFDPHHDPEDPAMNCTEFVTHLLTEGGGYSFALEPVPVNDNPSVRRVLCSLGFHLDPYAVPDGFARFPGARRVAWYARHASPSQAEALRRAWRLLHARFGRDALVGDYLDVDPVRLMAFGENTLAFLEWTKGYFAEHPTEDADQIDRVLEVLFEVFLEIPADLL